MLSHRRIIWKLLWTGLMLSLYWSPASAHSPHDDIFDVGCSPAFLQDERLYAVVRSVFLVSDDGGERWKRKLNGLDHKYMLYSLDVAGDGRTLYLTSLGDGVFRSQDGGESWQKVNDGLESLVIDLAVVSPHHPGHAFVTDVSGGLYRTMNWGENWERVPGDFGKATAIVFHPKQIGEVYLGDHLGVLHRSTDGGISWRKIYDIGGLGGITALVTSPEYPEDPVIMLGTSGGRLLRSEDTGKTFDNVAIASNDEPIVSLAVSPEYADDRVAFASVWDEGVFSSNDGGRSWILSNQGLKRHKQSESLGRPSFSRLVVSPGFSSDRKLFLASYNGLFESSDRGTSWRELSLMSPLNIVALSFSPDYQEDRRLALTTYLWGAFLTNDDGASWRPIYRGAKDRFPRDEGLIRMFRVEFSPDFAQDGTMFNSTWYHFFKSTDGGARWLRLPHSPAPEGARLDQGSYFAISPEFQGDNTLYVGIKSGLLLKSTDRGESFHVVKDAGNSIASVAISPAYAQDKTVFFGDNHGVYGSHDAGESWHFSRLVAEELRFEMPISPAYPESAVAAWNQHVLSQREKEFGIKLEVSPGYADDGTAFAGSPAGLFRSVDRGRSWCRLEGMGSDPYPLIEGVSLSPDFTRDRTLIVSARGRGLFRSRDGGDSFVSVGSTARKQEHQFAHYVGMAPKFPSVVFSPSYVLDRTLYGISGTELLRSSDDGETWETLPTPEVTAGARAYAWFRDSNARYSLRRKAKWLGTSVLVFAVLGAGVFFARNRKRRGYR